MDIFTEVSYAEFWQNSFFMFATEAFPGGGAGNRYQAPQKAVSDLFVDIQWPMKYFLWCGVEYCSILSCYIHLRAVLSRAN